MASRTMTASFLASPVTKHQPFAGARRGLIVAKASRPIEGERLSLDNKEESGSGRRRELVFAAAAAAACSIAKVAMADEPKRGSPDARKKYAPICVTMPTASICRY
ncbi:hypothetical protein HS088_TW04G00696 [Tripterygium wilfordii]|uniref:Photosystem II 5 kDa protein chloroplastic n=1 Tax=Tripterygium wilfordii TaxID=458696 RepID=A0A7J7DQU6_TRIWF|nr:photosystem II 5 kDa protein, chloroplastic-like [Tripterygium wilfordii]KAF5748738.1 hypothetical protein HS088_TW04G00696 [Tripterygium wilfordii]